MSQLGDNEIERAGVLFWDTLVVPLGRYAFNISSHVDIKDLSRWPIREYALDLNGASTFLRPMSEYHLLRIINNEDLGDFPHHPVGVRGLVGSERAAYTLRELVCYLTGSRSSKDGMMITNTGWEQFLADVDDFSVSWRMYYGTSERANQILRYSFRYQQHASHAKAVPIHYLGFTIPGGELKNGSLSMGELGIIARWASLILPSALRQGFKAASITLISAWGKRVRLTAAEVNLHAPYLTIGIGPTLDMPNILTLDSPEVLSLLRWAMATPYGDPKKYKLDPTGPSLFYRLPACRVQTSLRPPATVGQEPTTESADESDSNSLFDFMTADISAGEIDELRQTEAQVGLNTGTPGVLRGNQSHDLVL